MSQPKFYLATDDLAISHLQKQLGVVGLDITKSPSDSALREDLLTALTQPENIGDLHIKMLVSEPKQYSVDKTLIEYFIKAYFDILWSDDQQLREKLDFDIISGDHKELAFLEVKSDIVKAFVSGYISL